MANERLRSAMAKAQADIEAITQATGVDPKTVQRWLSGRIPIHVIVGRSPPCSEKTRVTYGPLLGLIFLLELKQPQRSSPPTDTARISQTRGGQTCWRPRDGESIYSAMPSCFSPNSSWTLRSASSTSAPAAARSASRLLTRTGHKPRAGRLGATRRNPSGADPHDTRPPSRRPDDSWR